MRDWICSKMQNEKLKNWNYYLNPGKRHTPSSFGFLLINTVFVFWKVIFRKLFFKLSCVCLSVQKLVNGKHFPVNWKIWLGFQESVFMKNLGGKHFPEIVKNLEMSYYLLIISNLVLKLLIAIYILFWIFIFQFHLLNFNFYINFGPYFYNCYLLFPYKFFIEIFYLLNLVLILLIISYFIWNNLWNVNYYYFNFFIFHFFFKFDLYYFDYYLFYLR
jgi:hypothetical protein